MEFLGLQIPDSFIAYLLAFFCFLLLCVIFAGLWNWEKWKLYMLAVLVSIIPSSIIPIPHLHAPITLVSMSWLGKRKNIRFSFFEYLVMAAFSYVVLGMLSLVWLIIWTEVLGLPK